MRVKCSKKRVKTVESVGKQQLKHIGKSAKRHVITPSKRVKVKHTRPSLTTVAQSFRFNPGLMGLVMAEPSVVQLGSALNQR